MECNICFNPKKVIKCNKCSFSCCMNCISKLNNIHLNYEDINYDCCVCKERNKLILRDIKDVNCLRNLYQTQTTKLLELENDIILISSIVLIYNAPVISDNVNYYKNAIIAIKTLQDNNTISLELYDSVNTVDFDNKIRKFNERDLFVKDHFIYSTDDYDYTLLKNTDFYELINNGDIDFV